MSIFKRKVKDDLLVEESVSESKVGKLLANKKVLIGLGVVLIIVVMLVVKSLLGGGSDTDFYSTFQGLFTNELGQFKYVIDVRTGEEGSLNVKTSKDGKQTTVSDLDSMKNEDTSSTASPDSTAEPSATGVSDTEATSEPDSDTGKHKFTDWNEHAVVQTDNWQYPNYKVIIEGVTNSVDPLETDIKISIATQAYNSLFTELICMDGKYYLDIESIQSWLNASADSYLMSLGKDLPKGSKWLVIPEKSFKVASRYAEASEKEASTVTGLTTLYKRFLVRLGVDISSFRSVMEDIGLSSNSGVDYITITNDNSNSFNNIVAWLDDSMLLIGSIECDYLSQAKEQKLFTDEQEKQERRELDNKVQAYYDAHKYFAGLRSTSDGYKQMNAQLTGNSRIYQNSNGNTAIEATLLATYTKEGVDHQINFNGYRLGEKGEIQVPQGSQVESTDDSWDTYKGIASNMMDYFNPTDIELGTQLEITPDNMSKKVLKDFIKLVNEAGCSDKWLTLNNVHSYIKKWANYKTNTLSTKEEIANTKLVKDLMNAINGISGGVVVKEEVKANEKVEKYPEVTKKINGVVVKLKYNKAKSTSDLLVMDATLMNGTNKAVTIDLTNFSLHTLLDSVYPANNDTLLKNYDNTFNTSKLKTKITLKGKGYDSAELYFVLSSDSGHMDLFLGNTKVGTAVQY